MLDASSIRLLIIEDHAHVAGYFAKGLKECSFAVDQAADGNAGLYMVWGELYEALIVDRILPSCEGLSIIAALRALVTLSDAGVKVSLEFRFHKAGHIAGIFSPAIGQRVSLLGHARQPQPVPVAARGSGLALARL